MFNAAGLSYHKQTIGLMLSEVSFVIIKLPVIKSIEQWLPRLTLILNVFLDSTVSVVSYF